MVDKLCSGYDRIERRTALHDGNESDGQGKIQGIGRISTSIAWWFNNYGPTDFDLDRRKK